jgi:hypothetical protein
LQTDVDSGDYSCLAHCRQLNSLSFLKKKE